MPPNNGLGDLLVVDAFQRIDGKLDKLDERLDKSDAVLAQYQEILAAQHDSLKEHMRRTDLLETKIATDVAAIRAEIPKAVDEEIRRTRNRYLINIGKGIAALAGTGIGAAAIKVVLTWVLQNWK